MMCTCWKRALQTAIDAVGTQTALAARIGVKAQHVSYWLNKARKLPAEHALPIVAAVEAAQDARGVAGEARVAVEPWQLCPEVYPVPEGAVGLSCGESEETGRCET